MSYLDSTDLKIYQLMFYKSIWLKLWSYSRVVDFVFELLVAQRYQFVITPLTWFDCGPVIRLFLFLIWNTSSPPKPKPSDRYVISPMIDGYARPYAFSVSDSNTNIVSTVSNKFFYALRNWNQIQIHRIVFKSPYDTIFRKTRIIQYEGSTYRSKYFYAKLWNDTFIYTREISFSHLLSITPLTRKEPLNTAASSSSRYSAPFQSSYRTSSSFHISNRKSQLIRIRTLYHTMYL